MRQPQTKLIIIILFVIAILSLGVGGMALAQEATFVAPKLVVNTSFLNIRTGPGVEYSVLVTVVGGTEFPVLAVASDKVWYQVNTDAGVGWVNVTFTLARGDFSRIPVIKLSDVREGDVDPSLGQGGGSVSTGRSSTRLWGLSVLGGDLRDGPSDKAKVVRAAVGPDLNNVYPLVNQAFNEGRLWYQTNIPGIGGVWNEAHQFKVRPLICGTGQSAVTVAEDVGLTSGPDGSGTAGLTISALEEYHVAGAANGMAKLELFDGSQGWLDINLIRGRSDTIKSYCVGVSTVNSSGSSSSTGGTTPTITAAAKVVINTGNLNIRSGPGAGYSVVATFPGGAELAVIGRAPDGVWYLVEWDSGQGWLNNQFVVFRGSYSSVPVIDTRTYFGG